MIWNSMLEHLYISLPSLIAERIERLSRAQILQRQLEHIKVLPDATMDKSSS